MNGLLVVDQNGATPAYISCQEGQKGCLEVLAKHGADLNKPQKVCAGCKSVVWTVEMQLAQTQT